MSCGGEQNEHVVWAKNVIFVDDLMINVMNMYYYEYY